MPKRQVRLFSQAHPANGRVGKRVAAGKIIGCRFLTQPLQKVFYQFQHN